MPYWAVILGVIGTVILILWGVSETQLNGPMTSWNMAQGTMEGVWPQNATVGGHSHLPFAGLPPGDPAARAMVSPQPVGQMAMQGGFANGGLNAQPNAATGQGFDPGVSFGGTPFPAQDAGGQYLGAQTLTGQSPTLPGFASDGSVLPVARPTGAPPILSGATPPHGDRGACTNCHQVLTMGGRLVPAISANAIMPHGYRGICSNCHQVTTGGRTAQPVAGITITTAPANTPNVEWLGLEVTGLGGSVVVTSVEAQARKAGLQRGDVMRSVNGQNIATMADLSMATQNGRLPQATVIAERAGQRLAFEVNAQPQPLAVSPPSPFGNPGSLATQPQAFATQPRAFPAQPQGFAGQPQGFAGQPQFGAPPPLAPRAFGPPDGVGALAQQGAAQPLGWPTQPPQSFGAPPMPVDPGLAQQRANF